MSNNKNTFTVDKSYKPKDEALHAELLKKLPKEAADSVCCTIEKLKEKKEKLK